MHQVFDIVFILPGVPREPSGGFKQIFIYANEIAKAGYSVALCFNCEHSLIAAGIPEPLRQTICKTAVRSYPRWFHLDPSIAKVCLFSIDEDSVPKSANIVATAVETAVPVSKLPESCGEQSYFIQDYENWRWNNEYVDSTFRLGMRNICVSRWLCNKVAGICGSQPLLVRNFVDERVFFEESVTRSNLEVSVLYHESPHKGFADAFRAIEIVHADVPDLVVNAFGAPRRPSWFPDYFHYTRFASEPNLRSIYSRSVAHLCGTRQEGFGLTGAESMFCGCALSLIHI